MIWVGSSVLIHEKEIGASSRFFRYQGVVLLAAKLIIESILFLSLVKRLDGGYFD